MKKFFKILHWVILTNFVAELVYCGYMVFYVLQFKSGGIGPLGPQVLEMPTDFFLKRRLYAIEFWVTLLGLTTYLAIIYKDELKAKL